MTFDPTITFGAVLNAIVLFGGFVAAFTRIGGRIDLLAQRLKAVEDVLKAHSDNDKRISVLEERVTNHGKLIATAQAELFALRKGEGWIKPNNRIGIDGEYT